MALPSRPALPVSREVRGLVATLRSPAPYAVLALALVILALAYQVRPAYTLQVGGQTDAPFWRGIYKPEQNPTTHAPYRWTEPVAILTLPGVGTAPYRLRLTLTGDRPTGFPAPDLTVSSANMPPVTFHLSPGPQTVEVSVPAVALAGGDLRVRLTTVNPFQASPDPRRLGVTLYKVEVLPEGAGLVIPPLDTLLLLALAAVLATLVAGTAGWAPGVARVVGLLWAAAEAGFLVGDRLWLTLIPEVLVGVLLAAAALLLACGPIWRRLYCAGGITWPEPDARALLAIFAGAFTARLAGQLHPQTVIIDLIFHQHRFDQVLAGQWLFTIKSDEWAGRETFYLPTPYIFMLPLQWLLHDELLTIRLFTVLVDTLAVFVVYYLARRAFNDGRAGIYAALLQVTFPLAVLPFSWGITANVFGQFTGLAAAAIAIGTFDRLRRPGPWLALTAVLALALLSHPGSVQLTGMLVGGLLVVWAGGRVWATRRDPAAARSSPPFWGAWLALALSLLAAVAVAYVAYYSHFLAAQLATLDAIRKERAAQQATAGFAIKVGGEVNDWSLGLRQRIIHDRSTWLLQGVQSFGAEAWAYFRAWPLLWAGLGFVVARRRAAGTAADPARRRMLLAAAVWAAVVALYALVGMLANLYVRYPLFALPLVAVGCGLLLAALARRGPAGAWLVRLVLLASTLEALSFWYMRITYANK